MRHFDPARMVPPSRISRIAPHSMRHLEPMEIFPIDLAHNHIGKRSFGLTINSFSDGRADVEILRHQSRFGLLNLAEGGKSLSSSRHEPGGWTDQNEATNTLKAALSEPAKNLPHKAILSCLSPANT